MGLFKYIKEEMTNIAKKDPAVNSKLEILMYPSFKAVLMYRLSHKLYLKGHYLIARWLCEKAKRKTGIEIHPGAEIAPGLFIDHGSGVVIGETAVIGKNCTMFHGATLGGTGKEKGKRHPTVGDNVFIGSGAKVLGNIIIGDNVKIGANAVVLQNVEKGATVVGVPAMAVKRKEY